MNRRISTAKKFSCSIALVILLSICLCFTSMALVWSIVSTDNNIFRSGAVKINLNDGKPIMEEGEIALGPGMTVQKTFFIENKSTSDIYYKLYFANVRGELADVLEITVKYGDKILYQGTASELTRSNASAADDIIKINERRELTCSFYFPSSCGNSYIQCELTFDLCADAVQTKNNPEKLFN